MNGGSRLSYYNYTIEVKKFAHIFFGYCYLHLTFSIYLSFGYLFTYIYIYIFICVFIHLFIYLLFSIKFLFFCDTYYPLIWSFSFIYVDMCMCESDHRWRPLRGARWKQFLGRLSCILYSTLHSSLPEKEHDSNVITFFQILNVIDKIIIVFIHSWLVSMVT